MNYAIMNQQLKIKFQNGLFVSDAVSVRGVAVGSWQLAVSSWQLAVGGWQLAVGAWRLAE